MEVAVYRLKLRPVGEPRPPVLWCTSGISLIYDAVPSHLLPLGADVGVIPDLEPASEAGLDVSKHRMDGGVLALQPSRKSMLFPETRAFQRDTCVDVWGHVFIQQEMLAHGVEVVREMNVVWQVAHETNRLARDLKMRKRVIDPLRDDPVGTREDWVI